MILQNTIDPSGNLCAIEARRVALMGNRGILHNEQREIVKPWAHKSWVCCATSFKNIDRRPLFRTPPNTYSELFFLDEATAYSAGHRPCNYCRREALKAFKHFWCLANRPGCSEKEISTKEIDSQLHLERVQRNRDKVTFQAPLAELPFGTMFKTENQAYLVGRTGILRWSFTGYTQCDTDLPSEVQVLTPLSIVAAFKAGLIPQVNESTTLMPIA